MAQREDLDGEFGVVTRSKSKIGRPKRYKVLLLNDDYTTMEFVVYVLEKIFKKSPAEAVQIMLSVHQKGSGLCGVFSQQVAEAKIEMVHKVARENKHPLKCAMEEE